MSFLFPSKPKVAPVPEPVADTSAEDQRKAAREKEEKRRRRVMSSLPGSRAELRITSRGIPRVS